jgi:PKD repeat protein
LGKAMTVTGLTFGADRSDDGPRTFAVRSSIDNFSANLSASVAPADTALSLPGSNVFFFAQDTTGGVGGCTITVNYSHLTGPVTFRIYAWNAEDASGSFSVDSVKVNGQFGVIENTQNYMEYSYCTHMFTMGQGDRMRAALNSTASGRSNLWQDGNHAFTGIDGYEQTCGPQADFYTLDPFVCVGATVQFKDNSGRATPTSWAWSFEGGDPATSNEQNPTVTFAEPGYHAVTLTCGNEYGSSSVTKTDVVNIGPAYSQVGVSLNEPFNTAGALSQWPNKNWENNSTYWNWNGQVGHDAPGCAMLNASATFDQTQDIFGFPGTFFADKDLLLTPMLDLRFLTDGQLNFWYAYATQTPTVDDITESLKVWSSTDCGETWSQRRAISGADLVTAGIASPGYVPGAGDWQQVSIALSSIFSTNNVRFAFEFTSGFYSNDIYLDDVNITGSNVGIDELAQNGGMVLMPNPASDHLSIALDLGAYEHGTLSFLDMTGRIIHEQAVAAGQQQLEFDLRKMGITSGVYLVQIKHANGQRVERLVVR